MGADEIKFKFKRNNKLIKKKEVANMKTLAVILFLIISFPLFAQEGQEWIISDSLYNSVPGDTSKQYNVGLQFDWFIYTQKDTSSTAWDVKIELGTIWKPTSASVADTFWVTAPLKDSTWSIVYSSTKAAAYKEVTIFSPGVQLIRLTSVDGSYILNRKLWYTIKKCNRW